MSANHVSIIAAFLALVLVVPSAADETDLALVKAKAALSLAQAQREREKLVKRDDAAVRRTGCYEDQASALAEAKRTGKPLVYVVGMNCDEIPTLRDDLHAEAVMCHMSELNGSRAARLAVLSKDLTHYWVFPRDQIAEGKFKAADIRKSWSPTMSSQWLLPECPDGKCPLPSQR